jgi:hypothetical protein
VKNATALMLFDGNMGYFSDILNAPAAGNQTLLYDLRCRSSDLLQPLDHGFFCHLTIQHGLFQAVQ